MNFKFFIKSLLRYIPFKKELFCFVKFFKVPPKSIYQHLYFNGVFNVRIGSGKKFKMHHLGFIQENEIFWEGIYNGWEKKSIALWIELATTSNSILDIGANTGLYALVAKTMNPKANVHAFEPLPAVYQALVNNVNINYYDINSHKVGLSDYDGPAHVFLPKGTEFAYSVTINKNMLNDTDATQLKLNVQQLSTFIRSNNIASIDLMKIDVETHEAEVLKGMGDYLKQFKPAIIIEVLSEEIAEQLNLLFKDMGYLYFNIDDLKNTIRKTDKITKSDHWNFLCCNKETAMRLKLL